MSQNPSPTHFSLKTVTSFMDNSMSNSDSKVSQFMTVKLTRNADVTDVILKNKTTKLIDPKNFFRDAIAIKLQSGYF